MAFSDSNFGRVIYASERGSYNTRPSGANLALKTLRLTSSDFSVSKNTVVSDELRSDRMVSTISEVGSTATGTVNFELSLGGKESQAGSFDDLLEAALCGTWLKQPYFLSTAGAENQFTSGLATTGTGFQLTSDEIRNVDIGQWIYLRGFANSNLNNWYKITGLGDRRNSLRTNSPFLNLVEETGAVAPVRNVWGVSLYVSGGTSGTSESYQLSITSGSSTITYTAATGASGRTTANIVAAFAAAIAANNTTTTNQIAVTKAIVSGSDLLLGADHSAGVESFLLKGPDDGSNITVTQGTVTDANDSFTITNNVTGVAGTGHTFTFEVQGTATGSTFLNETFANTPGAIFSGVGASDWAYDSTDKELDNSASNNTPLVLTPTTFTANKWYGLIVQVVKRTNGTLTISSTGNTVLGTTTIDFNGYATVFFRADAATEAISFTPTSNFDGSIKSIKITSGDQLQLNLAHDVGQSAVTFYASGVNNNDFALNLARSIDRSAYFNATASANKIIVVNTNTSYVSQVSGIRASIPDIVYIRTDPQPIAVEAAAQTITVSGKMLRNGVVKRSFVVEQGFTDVNEYFEYRGQRVGSLSLDVSSGSVITGSLGFQGATSARSTSSISTVASATLAAATEYPVVNATENVGDVSEAGEILSNTIQSLSLSVDNALRDQMAVGEKYPKGVGYGRQTVSGSMTVYFENGALYDKFLNHTYTSISFDAFDGTATTPYRIRITLPKVMFQTDNPNVPGIDQDVMESIDFTSVYDPVTRAQIQIDVAQ